MVFTVYVTPGKPGGIGLDGGKMIVLQRSTVLLITFK